MLIVPFSVFQAVWLWPNRSVRLLSVAWAMALLWAVQGVWESQHWFDVAVAWQAAYCRDIAPAQCQSPSIQDRHQLSIESVDASDRSLLRPSLKQSTRLLSQALLRTVEQSTIAESAPLVPHGVVSGLQLVFQDSIQDTHQIWSHCNSLPESRWLLGNPRAEITTDIPYENHNQNRATPLNFI